MNENYIYLTKRLDLLIALNNGITKNDLYGLDCFFYLDFALMYNSHYWDILCKANLCDYFWNIFLSNGEYAKEPLYLPHLSMNVEFNKWYTCKLKIALKKL